MSLSGAIYRKLMVMLLQGELVPGQMINRRQIAASLDVSVAPVLEAMVLLENEGFLETIPRKGTQVKIIREEDVRGQFIFRDALESKAARMYYGAPLTGRMGELESFALRVDQAPSDHLEDWKTEILFHRELVALAGVPALTDAFDRAMRIHLFYAMVRIIPAHRATERDNHVVLLRNLSEAEGPDQAERIIRSHVWYGKEAILGENCPV
jgi:GntR family transcriptional regulator, rspAB operon transcriptional repressor